MNQKFQSATSLHLIKYRVEGIQLSMQTDDHRESVQKLLKKYIDTYIFPKIDLNDIEISIDYIAVFDSPLKNIGINDNLD